MTETEIMIQEFESLIGSTNEKDIQRKEEIARWIEEHKTSEVENMVSSMAHRQMDAVEISMKEIEQEVMRSQIDDVTYKLIPWSYIAREYFHKTPGWLQQRINGQPVRGKVYTLSTEQKATLSLALNDICNKIGSYRQALA